MEWSGVEVMIAYRITLFGEGGWTEVERHAVRCRDCRKPDREGRPQTRAGGTSNINSIVVVHVVRMDGCCVFIPILPPSYGGHELDPLLTYRVASF